MRNITGYHLVCVLYNSSGNKRTVSKQTVERLLASEKLKGFRCYVGAGANLMTRLSRSNNSLIGELSDCKSTIGNIKEIKKFVDLMGISSKEIIIVSHFYHKKRVLFLSKIFNLRVNFLSVEELLDMPTTRKSYLELLKMFITKFLIKLNLI